MMNESGGEGMEAFILPALFDSLLPAEYVWKDFHRMAERKRWEWKDGVRTLILEEVSPGVLQVIRLISPDASDYTNPAWAPGREMTARYRLDP